MTASAHRLSSVVLPDDGPLRRDPPRPPERRDGSYDEEFDALTLFYDAFRHPVDGTVLLVGPELRNARAAVEQMEVTSTADGRSGTLTFSDQNRLVRATVAGLDGAERLRITGLPGRSRDLVVQPNHADLFAGLRVLMTASKDNDLGWIAEWAEFHRSAHGAEAALFYDNGSTRYGLGEIAETLTRVFGHGRVVVLAWPFKWGPMGLPDGFGDWDSDYCQYGILEHARWRYLARARSVLNLDVDELVISPQRESIFVAAEESTLGYLEMPRCWVVGEPPATGSLRYADFRFREIALMRWNKWCVVPGRCGEGHQWAVHCVLGFPTVVAPPDRFTARHFWSVSTRWRAHRAVPILPDAARHVVDDDLVAQLSDVLGEVI